MPQVTILRRERSVRSQAPGLAEEVVAVTYSTPAIPPRIVYLPEASYRDATDAELKAQPLYRVVAKDKPAQDAELTTIRQDLERARSFTPQSFQV